MRALQVEPSSSPAYSYQSRYQAPSTSQAYRSHVHPPTASISYPALTEARSNPLPSSLPPSRPPSTAAPQATPSASSTAAPPSWAGLRTMNFSPSIVTAFLDRAAKNTKKRIETCGLLLGTLDSGMFSAFLLEHTLAGDRR